MASAVVNEMASAEWGNPFERQIGTPGQARVMSPAVDGHVRALYVQQICSYRGAGG
jgi:hypothetical protein